MVTIGTTNTGETMRVQLRALLTMAMVLTPLGGMAWLDTAHAQSPRLSKAADPTYQTNGRVLAVAVVGNTVYIGGDFTAVRPPGAPAGTRETARSHLAAFRVDTGALWHWRPSANGIVNALAASPNGRRIYVGGSFTRLSGEHRHNVGAVAATRRGAVSKFRADTNGTVLAIATNGRRVYLGGEFTQVKHQSRIHLAALDSSRHLVSTWRPRANSTVRSIAVSRHGNFVYVGGEFGTINNKPNAHLAKLSGGRTGKVQTWKRHPIYSVWKVIAKRHAVYVGGNGTGGGIAAYGLKGRNLWGVQTDGGVQALAVYHGALLVGGHFHNVCVGISPGPQGGFHCPTVLAPRARLLALTRSTGALQSWNPRANSGMGVFAMAATGRLVYAGGVFTEINNLPQQGFTRFSLP
jgi:hypothetical protein